MISCSGLLGFEGSLGAWNLQPHYVSSIWLETDAMVTFLDLDLIVVSILGDFFHILSPIYGVFNRYEF